MSMSQPTTTTQQQQAQQQAQQQQQPQGSGSAGGSAAVPNKASEVGWLFVPQYYTFMNKDPARLHCFYTKKSTMVHGTENEDVASNVGQQAIHEKFQAMGFEDTKVYVSNVDSQSSADGGIVIQVLGELSNKGGKWRKFAQTFFLAQQPNGFYVLNDIFRYLKDEEDEPEQEPEQEEPAAEAPAESAADAPPVSVADTPASHEAAAAATQETAGGAAAAAPEASTAPPQSEGIPPAVKSTPTGAAIAASNNARKQPQQSQQPQQPQQPHAANEPPKPAAPKTWANLAASGANRWGNTASDKRGTSEATQPVQAAPENKPGKAKPQGHHGQAQAHVFIKNVPPSLPQDELRRSLETQFGVTKECHVNTSRGFAFVEFADADAARKAISASSHGGVKIGSATIVIEKRRPHEPGNSTNNHPGRGGRGAHRGGAHAAH